MSQSRMQSAVETVASTAIGFVVALIATHTVLPLFGYDVTPSHSVGITVIFTAISLIRGWCVRRLFNRLHGARA